MHPLAFRLSERAEIAGLSLDDRLRDRLLAYYDILVRWNTTINLTALPDRSDEALDRLLLEPVAASEFLRRNGSLADLGSGGGSPAIPLALALDPSRLVMVESKGRKASFLREAARAVGLSATVEAARFEDTSKASAYQGTFDVVSMRAVRMDLDTLGAAGRFLAPTGQLGLFVSAATTVPLPPGLSLTERFRLLRNAELLMVEKCST